MSSTSSQALSPGDEVHFFHVVPNPQSKLLGGGVGLADVGEFMIAPPDPKDDQKQVPATNFHAPLCLIAWHTYTAWMRFKFVQSHRPLHKYVGYHT